MPIPLYKPGPSLPDRSGSDPFLSGPAFDSSKMDTNAMSFKASRNGLKISSISRRALKTFTPAAKDEQYSEKPASGFNKSSIDKSRAYNGKPAPFPMLNLAYINQCAGWPGNPVNPPTPLSHPPTPLACPPTNTAATPLTSSSFGFGPDGSPISKDRVVPNKPNIAALRMARMDGQRDMLSPFALPLYQPQKYMAYNLDTANTKIPAPTAPLSPPPTPIAKNSVTSPKAKLTPASKQPAILEDSKPVPDPRSISSKYLAERKVLPAFNAQYDMLDELGSGGFGFVIRAKRRCDGLIVAVKFIYRERIPSHGWVRARGWTKMPDGRPNPSEKLVPMEAYVLRMVRHKGVVAFLDLMEDENTFYLVMEHHGTPWLLPDESEDEGRLLTSPSADGLAKTPEASYSVLSVSPVSSLGPSTPVSPTPPNRLAPPPMLRRSSCDLFECIEQHSRLSEDQARYVFGQIVDVVYHLASMGICHRDIKDENIVVDQNFRVKLIDFGSAIIFDVRKPPPYHTRFFGTVKFAASEILRGHKYRAPHAEIWSLGVLLSVLLTGETPFHDPEQAIIGRLSKPKCAVSHAAMDLMLGCLEVDPEARLTISDLKAHSWLTYPSKNTK